VYVAGTEGNKAVYWKNGTPHSLPADGSTGSFYVFDGNIYVAGADTIHSVSVATYWKNGTPHHLTKGTKDATASAIYVDNNGVYVTGTKKTGNFAERDGAKFPITKAMYWENGTLHYLFAKRTANPNAIFATDSDVFVAGTTINVTYAGVPATVYWKDSTLHILSSISSGFPSGANSIYVSNDDVYVAGFDRNGAGYWENGTQNTLKNGSTATSIYVSEGDVYVAGYKYKYNDPNSLGYAAVYWKNGIRHKLADNGKALSITVTNTKVK
jgi:predicted heme/steroid binding protein